LRNIDQTKKPIPKINFLIGILSERHKSIDAHGLKIQGRGYLKFLPKSLGGVKAFRKNCMGGPPNLNFIAFLLTSVLKFAWGSYINQSPCPSPPSLHLCIKETLFVFAMKLNSLKSLFTYEKDIVG